MDISDCKSVDNSTLVNAIDKLTTERDERVKTLLGAGGPKSGRPPKALSKNGFNGAPEGDLDRDQAGEA